jgi:hypothetical protein
MLSTAITILWTPQRRTAAQVRELSAWPEGALGQEADDGFADPYT